MFAFDLEKKVQEQLGWTPQQIAKSSHSQLQTALKTPLANRVIVKEDVVQLDLFSKNSPSKSSSSSSSSSSFACLPSSSSSLSSSLPSSSLSSSSSFYNPNELITKLQNLKIKYNEKTQFKSSKISRLESADIQILEKALEKNLDEINKITKEITESIAQLSIQIADKRELLTMLDIDDISVPGIKLRIEQLNNQMDSLKQKC